ncbi:NAD(P)/FAD-dependent oxidoreductase [Leekyejoonella antrihumi]|uniref:FAD-dependent oxidoreductase n=1 Tax=Leekyejoonella antrihumi TaxID=1660198 RepID=A0A563E5S9_9MICO|nr:FAD-dependent oxidoreductase [Leekyejoonella antrihumi]TWP37876.1 FAD-dependent oxidoreductase [Leekyejoonella antrihumi]
MTTTHHSAAARAALAGANPRPFWLDSADRPAARPALNGAVTCDLAVVGGGYAGLWTALIAKERDPARKVVLLEGNRIAWAASGRNGGFCAASLTHGSANGRQHFPDELDTLERLGVENLDELEATIDRYGIDCDFERTGSLDVATAAHEVDWLREDADADAGIRFLDQEEVRAQVNSPTYLAGLWDTRGTALVHPAKLAWGLLAACLDLGVDVFEHTPVRSLDADSGRVTLHTDDGSVRAAHVALATNVFPSLLRRTRPHTVPVYDYALMTQPLTPEQRDAIGWQNRQGLGDVSNLFHYYRQTADHRILFGGYDAVYHYGRRVKPEYDQRPETFGKLADHFFETFPQLEGLKFSHTWGGAIDTCSRFFAFFATAHHGRVAFTAGYTGLGVGATRFGAKVLLDLLSGETTELTQLQMVRKMPKPFPPEPLAWCGIKLTTDALIRADGNEGRRGLWLKALDRAGMGFDS